MASPLPNYLRSFRKHTCLSQDEVAVLLGGSSGSKIARYERSARLPTLETALKLSLVYGVSVNRLFEGLVEGLGEEVSLQAKILLEDLRLETPTDALLERWRVVEHLAHPAPKFYGTDPLD